MQELDQITIAPTGASDDTTAETGESLIRKDVPPVDLTQEQEAVIACGKGTHLVIAGAGTGKTRVLTQRIIHLIETGAAKPQEILAVTFTNKAAREMRERLETYLGEHVKKVWVGSFHGISLEFVKRHARDMGFRNERIGILDEDGQTNLMIEVLQKMTSPNVFVPRKVAALLLKQILEWKERGLTPQQVYPETLQNNLQNKALEAYGAYQAALLERNVCDFADLILHPVVLMRRDKRVRDYWRDRIKYVLVDEMQDVNRLQLEWLFHLTGRNGNIFCVGDVRQAIYEWRNASPDIMRQLGHHFDNVTVHGITQNFRSTAEIVEIANLVVKDLPGFSSMALSSRVHGPAPRIELFDKQDDEVAFIVEEIASRIALGQPTNEIAILTRTQVDLLPFEEAMRARSIPYRLVGGGRFKDNRFVLDVLAYLRLANNPYDSLAFIRAANAPERHIRRQLLRDIDAAAFKEGCEVVSVLSEIDRFDTKYSLGMTVTDRANMRHLAEVVDEVSMTLVTGRRAIGRAIRKILETTGYIAWATFIDESGNAEEILEELVDLGDATRLSATEFISRILSGDLGDESVQDGVSLSTIHSAKGLEYDLVFTPFLVEEKLPHYRALRDNADPHEERRLAHVAWTRPKKELFITASWLTDLRGSKPSRYLRDVGLDDGFDPLVVGA